MTTNSNFRVKNGLEVATTATVSTLIFSGDGTPITSYSQLVGAQGAAGAQGAVGAQGFQGEAGFATTATLRSANGLASVALDNTGMLLWNSQKESISTGTVGGIGYFLFRNRWNGIADTNNFTHFSLQSNGFNLRHSSTATGILDSKLYRIDNTGITFPDNTLQTTAYTGAAGAQGAQGAQGEAGAEGAQGPQGYQGEAATTGDLTFSGTQIVGTGTGGVAGSIEIVPNDQLLANGQYVVIRPTAAFDGNHIHIEKGNSSADLMLGDDDQYVKLASTGTITINTFDTSTGTEYQFSSAGIRFPDGTFQTTAYISTATPPPEGAWPQVDYLIVAGGGGGGGVIGGGGGAGGFTTGTTTLTLATEYTITVGAGGTGAPGTNVAGTDGGNTSFDTIAETIGGGGGAAWNASGQLPGDGGSGGGGGAGANITGGGGTVGQGNDGGDGVSVDSPSEYAAGGGGGAGAAGSNANPGDGGAGLPNSYVGSEVYFAGGGGGGAWYGTASAGAGGNGGGGAGGPDEATDGVAGEVDRGAGGGGAGYTDSVGFGSGGNGGSGFVVIRYASPTQEATGGTVVDTYDVDGVTYWFHAFLGSGTFTS
jgi:hypothetical protein